MPLIRRIPKRGFKSPFKKEYTVVNVGELEDFDNGTVISGEFLCENGYITGFGADGLKILGDGELTKSITVKASKFTKSAVEKIEKAGGKAEVI